MIQWIYSEKGSQLFYSLWQSKACAELQLILPMTAIGEI